MAQSYPTATEDQIANLAVYTSCDISDALVKLKVPGGGFIADLHLYAAPHNDQRESHTPTIAPASTVLFVPKGDTSQAESLPPSNISQDTHWADNTLPGTVVVIQQPDGQKNAVCGGIMALRMKVREARGIVVAGRARDINELKSTGLPIWARGLSTVGAGAASLPWAVQVPLLIDETSVRPGDLVFSDPVNGVVVIPADKVAQVLELLPKLTSADDKVKSDVLKGATVYDAFKTHRSQL